MSVEMRKLLHIPIVHTPEDMGSHRAAVKKEYIAKHGLSKWNDHNKIVDKFWQELGKILLTLPVDYTIVKVYQDGLPVFDRELELVEELAKAGSRNYQIILKLLGRGATVVGTEDPNLLIEERNRLNQNGNVGYSYDDLMERRDKYIVQRIVTTLNVGEIGILLIGALHRATDKLPKDIQVYRSISDLREKNFEWE